jgi:hypothetical protein
MGTTICVKCLRLPYTVFDSSEYAVHYIQYCTYVRTETYFPRQRHEIIFNSDFFIFSSQSLIIGFSYLQFYVPEIQ